MKSRKPRIIVVSLILIAALAMWSYRRLQVVKAAEFLPTRPTAAFVPSGTRIPVSLSNGITESTDAGDPIVGFVSLPVMVRDVVDIFPGTQLVGTVEQIVRKGENATVTLHFTQLITADTTL